MPGFFDGLNSALDQAAQRKLYGQQSQAMQSQQAGQAALGSAFGGSPSVPGAQNPLQQIVSKLGQLIQPQQPRATPQRPAGGGQPAGQQQPMGSSSGGGPLTVGVPQGQMSLQQIAAIIKQRNPNIDAQTMFQALNAALPMMNAQSRQQMAQLNYGLKQRAEDFKEGPAFQEKQTHDRATEGVQSGNLGERTRHDTAMEGQGQQKLQVAAANFREREGRLSEQFKTRVQAAKDKLDQVKTTADKAQAFREMEAAQKEYGQTVSTMIRNDNSFSDPETKKGIQDELQKRLDGYGKQIDALKLQERTRAQTGGATSTGGVGGFSSNNQPDIPERQSMAIALRKKGLADQATGTGANKPPAAPQRQPGATIQVGGKTYRFKGGDWDSQASWEPVQ